MKRFYGIFLKGLLTLLPITITIYLVLWLGRTLDTLFGPPLRLIFAENYIPGMGIGLSIVVIFLVGVLVNNYVAAQFFKWLEHQVQRVPFIKTIYNPLRDILQLFTNKESQKKQRVVLIELPGTGTQVLGFVTRDQFSDLPPSVPAGFVAVFVPLSYAMGGITVLAPRDRIREVALPADKAMQLAITGWLKSE